MKNHGKLGKNLVKYLAVLWYRSAEIHGFAEKEIDT